MGIEYVGRRRKTARKGKRNEHRAARREQLISDRALADENLALIDKPRKKPPVAFKATRADQRVECSVCFVRIELGQTIHVRRDGTLAHYRHDKPKRVETVCPTCFLVTPCECSE